MKKSLLFISCMLMFFAFSSSSFAANGKLVQKSSDEYEVLGEKFEVLTWVDNDNGSLMYTVPTKVNNKQAVAQFVDELAGKKTNYGEEPSHSTLGFKTNWSRDLTGYATNSNDAKITWKTSGYNEDAFFYPITTQEMVVNEGNISAYWNGSGNADKIVLSYQYKFTGFNVVLSFPPALQEIGDTVKYTFSPVDDQWYLITTSESGKAESRGLFTGADLKTNADIYKGGYIYRPTIETKVKFTDGN
ncbi:hypothetical protein BBG47_27355 [Paenibacillus sp. KS1]|uniref:hypothetical protein n=1 Tax=Paenibacillus sp. KS1 TaxID=1849249 RepID=UPI000806562F|nr:hypothetical protein [Paenibacillus sp. KS1]OBY76398.1 hypothetical protein BBG47_27355 [Paenibacillus sp. KS1]